MEKTGNEVEKLITAFSVTEHGTGHLVNIVGYIQLQPTQNPSEDVIGIIELHDQVVPILDFRKEKKTDITDLCCLVILENPVGDTTIMTGRLYESPNQFYESVIEPKDSSASPNSILETMK